MSEAKLDTSRNRLLTEVRNLIEPVIRTSGLELVDIEYFRGPSGMVLRLVIDKSGGVTIDDCAEVSRVVGDILDVNDPISGAYHLEVSSPGINRPLKTEKDFSRFAGQKAYIETKAPLNGQRRFKGILQGLYGGVIRLTCGQTTVEIPWDQLAKARLDII